jgi:pilus assembly protein Flp/PilA
MRVDTSTFLRNRVENYGAGIVRRLIDDKNGVTAIEYGLIAALIAIAAITMMSLVGTDLTATFSTVAASL